MALDTGGEATAASESGFYPGEVPLHQAKRSPLSPWLRPHILWAAAGAVGGYRLRPLAGQPHRRRLPGRAEHRPEQRRHGPRARLRRGRLARRHRRAQVPADQAVGREPAPAVPDTSWTRYFKMTEDHKVVGLQYTVGVLIFFFTGGLFAMLIRTELLSPTNPHLRARGLHRDRLRARHDHDDDGDVGRRRHARQLARPAHDRLAPHGVPARRGLLVLDLRGRVPRDPVRAVPRRVPDRLDRVRAAADPGVRGDGRLPRRLRDHRHRHDRGGLQPRRDDHQLPRAGHDLEPGPDLRLGHPRHLRAADARHPDARHGGVLRDPRPHRADRVLRQRARRQQLLVAEPLLVLRPPRGVHHGAAGLRHRDGDPARSSPESRCSPTRSPPPA